MKTAGRCAIAFGLIAAAYAVISTPTASVSARRYKAPPAAAEAADTVLFNGTVLTVDANDRVAQAVAIRGGKILAVGSNDEVRRLATKSTRVIDLHGRTVTPSLIDTHAHFQEVEALYSLDLSDATSIAEIAQRVKAKVATLKPGEWVQGGGWDNGKLTELRFIRASDLDAVSPHNPVWFVHTTGHFGVANSYALNLAHITAETPNPQAGTIDRDENGRPTGILKESAMELVTKLIPPYSHEQKRNGMLKLIADFNREGMTAAKDPGIEQDRWDLYRELLDEHKLTVRVFALWLGGRTMDSAHAVLNRIGSLPKPPGSFGDGTLLSGGIKLFMDGSGGARTAWLYKEWNKNRTEVDTGNYGYPAIEPDVYRQMVRLFHDSGYHVGTHAIGDRAIDWVVDTYAEVLKEKPTHGLRHSIIHCNIPSDHAIATMAVLQKQYDAGYPEAQSTFMWWIGDTYAGNFGPERSLRLMPFRTYLEKGMRWTGGSDYSVTPFPARFGIWASIERKTLKGVYGAQPFGTAEAVDVHAALRSYTSWAARQLFLEDKIGSIEPGKYADLAVWDRNMYAIPADEIRNIHCEMTFLQGKVVFQAQGAQ
jgi:predicted amidohydrolase YtcJ